MAFESFKPVDGQCYCVPIYANYGIASICLVINYKIKVYLLKKSTDENSEGPLQEQDQGRLEKSSEPLIDEALQKPRSDVDDQSSKNLELIRPSFGTFA